jgi:hypothetical protein
MDITDEITQNIELIANDTLNQFEKVAEAAKNALLRASSGADSLASINTMTSNAVQSLRKVDQENRESYQKLCVNRLLQE